MFVLFILAILFWLFDPKPPKKPANTSGAAIKKTNTAAIFEDENFLKLPIIALYNI